MTRSSFGHLLSPITVNGVTLRNRIISTCSGPHFVQGSETWPTEGLIMHYANKAKGGAAVVTCKANQPKVVIDPHDQNLDITIPANQHYFAQMAEAVHFYGAKASMLAQPPITLTEGWDASTGVPSEIVEGDGSEMHLGKEAPEDVLMAIADAYAEHAYLAHGLGFDGCFIHMSYRLMFPGRFLSPYTNKRTDKYGGDVHGRARFPLLIAKRIKEACGRQFFIEISCTGQEPELEGGVTIADTVQLAKELEHYVDFMQIRGTFIDVSQATYLDTRRLPHYEVTAQIAQAVHEAGIQTKITLIGGCQHPDLLDGIIARGEADMIGSARGFLSDPDWVNKAYEDRADEITPCLRCNKCHQAKVNDWVSTCSVNPAFGLEHRLALLDTPLTPTKKVAVIGGGPAGMQTALETAARGHDVTIYEQGDALGGLLNLAVVPDIKWTLKEYRDHLIHMVGKKGIRVLLNTKATPDAIAAQDYDEVVVAIGSDPCIPAIPGVEKAVTVLDALRDHTALAKSVVIVGGGEIGVETGIHLAQNGHEVMVLEMLDTLAAGCAPIHFRKLFRDLWEATPGFAYQLHARCTRIEDGRVVYEDPAGAEHTVPADSVVLAVGQKSRREEAVSFFGAAARVHMIGDCETVGSIRECSRGGFAVARLI